MDGEGAALPEQAAGSEEGIVQVPENRLVVISKPRNLVAVLVRPDARGFDVHVVAGD